MNIKPSKNNKLLLSFTKYCLRHPEERFWQALRNWSNINILWAEKEEGLVDTFYWNKKNE